MKKLLITGSRGLLGSACVRQFASQYQIQTIEGDLRNKGLVEDWFMGNRPDYVINCAAKVGGVKANRDFPVEFIIDNLEIQNNVIEVSSDFGVEKLIQIGTSCLYPAKAQMPVREESLLTGPFDESVAAYATAKLAGYALCKAYSKQFGRNFMTASPCNLYGPNDSYGPSAHVIPALMVRLEQAMKTGEPLVVWGDGTAIREFLYVDDAADALGYVLEKWNSPELINIGSGLGTNIRTLVETLIEVAQADVDVVWDDSQPTGIYQKTFSREKIEKLGWGATHSLEDGLWKTWLDFQRNANRRIK